MNESTLYLIVMLLELVIIVAIAGPRIIHYIKKLWTNKNTIWVWYIGQNNRLQGQDVVIGTKNSSLEISLGEKSFLFDPDRVYKIPKGVPVLGNKNCIFYTYKDCSPIDFHKVSNQNVKTPDAFYSALNTKVLKETMAGANDIMKAALPFFWILVFILIAYFGAKQMGWLG